MLKKSALAVVIALALVVPLARADSVSPDPAVSFTGATYGNDPTGASYSLGWWFSTNTAVTVNWLGVLDNAQAPLTGSEEVGIYDSSGDLLTSAWVTPTDTIDGNFAWQSITPITLAAGETYAIMASVGPNLIAWSPQGLTVSPEINLITDGWTYSSTLTFPEYSDGTNGYFGPNFDADTAVPEPTTMALFLLGAGGLLTAVRRRK